MVVNECPRTVMPANYPLHSCLFIQKCLICCNHFYRFIVLLTLHLTWPSTTTLTDPHSYLFIFKKCFCHIGWYFKGSFSGWSLSSNLRKWLRRHFLCVRVGWFPSISVVIARWEPKIDEVMTFLVKHEKYLMIFIRYRYNCIFIEFRHSAAWSP